MNKKKYFIKQKLIGVALILLGLLSMTIEKDATAAIVIIPIGCILIFTKEAWLTDYYEENEGES